MKGMKDGDGDQRRENDSRVSKSICSLSVANQNVEAASVEPFEGVFVGKRRKQEKEQAELVEDLHK